MISSSTSQVIRSVMQLAWFFFLLPAFAKPRLRALGLATSFPLRREDLPQSSFSREVTDIDQWQQGGGLVWANSRTENRVRRETGGKRSHAREPLRAPPSCKTLPLSKQTEATAFGLSVFLSNVTRRVENLTTGWYLVKYHTWVARKYFLGVVVVLFCFFFVNFNKHWHSRSLFSVLAWMGASKRKYVITGHKHAVTSIWLPPGLKCKFTTVYISTTLY